MIRLNLHSFFSYSNLDECEKGRHDCHINANCANTPGSYNYTCRPGFTGNGSICEGKNLPVNFYDAFIESGLIAPFDTLFLVTLTLKPRWSPTIVSGARPQQSYGSSL